MDMGTLTLSAEGMTINGRPALTLESVQQWFNDAFGVVPEAVPSHLSHRLLIIARFSNLSGSGHQNLTKCAVAIHPRCAGAA